MNRAPPRRESLRRATLGRVESREAEPCDFGDDDHVHDGPEKFWIPPCYWVEVGSAPDRDIRLLPNADITRTLANFFEGGTDCFNNVICTCEEEIPLYLCLPALVRSAGAAGRALALIVAGPDALLGSSAGAQACEDCADDRLGETTFQSWMDAGLAVLAIGRGELGRSSADPLGTMEEIRTGLDMVEEIRAGLVDVDTRRIRELSEAVVRLQRGKAAYAFFHSPGAYAWVRTRLEARKALIA